MGWCNRLLLASKLHVLYPHVSSCLWAVSYLYCILLTHIIHIFMWYKAYTYSCAWRFCWLLHLKLYYCVLLWESHSYHFNWMSMMLLRAVQWNLCMYYGYLGTVHNCPNHQGVLITQVSSYAKAPFGTIVKYVDCAGALIFKYPN